MELYPPANIGLWLSSVLFVCLVLFLLIACSDWFGLGSLCGCYKKPDYVTGRVKIFESYQYMSMNRTQKYRERVKFRLES